VYRNGYERRSRYETHYRGSRRKKWRLESKFQTYVPGNRVSKESEEWTYKGKTWIEKEVREDLSEKEGRNLEGLYENRRVELKFGFEEKHALREKRVKETPDRRKVAHIRTLLERSKQTRENPRQRKNRTQRFTQKDKDVHIGNQGERRSGIDEFEWMDGDGEILIASPTTQYFAKVKNLVRIMERHGSHRGSNEELKSREHVSKRKKVPEKKRTQRYPRWTELDTWSNQVMQMVEDENLQKVLNGEEVNMSYATYRELGKKVRYLYAVERSDRWRTKK